MVLHRKYPVVKFIQSDAPVNILAEYNELIFDEDSKIIDDHSYTTDEIRALCKDLRVIGKSDMKILIKWQKKMDEHLKALRKAEISSSQEKVEVKEPNEEEIEALRDEKLQKAIDAMKKRDLARQKRLKRKHKEQRAKAKEISDVAGDQNDQEHSEMFNLKYVTTEDVLERLQNDNIAEVESSDESDSEQDESKDIDMFLDADLIREREIEEELDAMFSDYKARRKEADRRARKKARQMGIVDDNDEELKTSESEQEQEEDEEEIDEVSEDEQLHETILDDSDASKAKHPLNVELYPAPTQEEVADMWFERDLLKDIDLEIKNPSTKAGSKPYGPELPASLKRKRAAEQFAEESDAEDEAPVEKKHSKKKADDDFEVVEKETYSDFSDDSDAVAETLAIGTAMLRKKRREQILDDSYNRYAFDDDADLPEWFLDDQQKFNKASKPITRSEIEYFKERFKAISARPLKKIAEAKARKKVRALRRWEKVKGQADSIAASEELSTGEKFKRLEKLYQKKREKKREKVYAVSKKSGGTRDVKRKPGSMIVRVDSRMKKDKRGEKARNKRKSRGRGRH
jgi:AdoMet-dependent rRNA methyltransferase SPB1